MHGTSEALTREEDLVTTPTLEQSAYREPLTYISINDDMVAAVLGRLKPNKSPGGDGLHPRVLVEIKNEMSTPLRMIFTRSLHAGQLPSSGKEANVTPIYKKGKRHIPENYRPVSLTSMAGECMERLIRDAIMTHMTENDLLLPKQHVFIQGRSCVTQLNVQRRATKLIPELRDRDYEDRLRALKLSSLYYRTARGDMIEAYKSTHRTYKTEQEPLYHDKRPLPQAQERTL